jgi:hypothetical protein
MRINRLRLRKQQLALQAENRAEQNSVQDAVADLTKVVSAVQAELVAKASGSPTVQSAINELSDKVADVQAEAAVSSGMVQVAAAPDLKVGQTLTPQQARELAAKLLADADAAEKP